MKRLLKSNTGPGGSLDNDKFLRAILQLRNTPDLDCNLSPAEILFGKPLRDAFSFVNRLEKYSNPNIRPTWREAWRDKEIALRQRFHRSSESLQEHSRPLPPLVVGDKCYIQNQVGNHSKRWDRSGTVVEVLGHDSYRMKVDGSGRVTCRNRQFLRRFSEPSLDISLADPTSRSVPTRFPHTSSAPHASPVTGQSALVQPSLHPTEESSTHATSAMPAAQPAWELSDRSKTSGHSSVVPPQDITERDASATVVTPDDSHPVAVPCNPRPRRQVCAPKIYEPETGKWVVLILSCYKHVGGC